MIRVTVSYWGEGISFSGSEGKLTELTNIRTAYKRDELQLIHNEKTKSMMDRKLTVGEKVAQLAASYEKLKALDQELWLNYPNDYIWFFDLRGYPSYIFLDQEGTYDRELVQRIQNVDVELMKERLELK